jgi:hypothetical protein
MKEDAMSNESKTNKFENNEPETGAHCSACEDGIDGLDADLQLETKPSARRLSTDSWAVLLALAAAALVKLHILNTVKW